EFDKRDDRPQSHQFNTYTSATRNNSRNMMNTQSGVMSSSRNNRIVERNNHELNIPHDTLHNLETDLPNLDFITSNKNYSVNEFRIKLLENLKLKYGIIAETNILFLRSEGIVEDLFNWASLATPEDLIKKPMFSI